MNFKGDEKGNDEKKHLALIEHFQKVLKKGNTNANSQTMDKQKEENIKKHKEQDKQDLNVTAPVQQKEKNDK